MGIILNRRRVMGGKSLPYDAEIEYLEKTQQTGNCYIITDYIPQAANEPIFRLAFMFNGFYGNASWDGAVYHTYVSQSTQTYRILRQNNNLYKVQISHGENADWAIALGLSIDTGVVYRVLADKRLGYYLNDRRIGNINPSGGTNTDKLKIFAGSITGRIYYFKVEEFQNIVLDLIPVRIGTTGYMYDKISKQLFGNAGTGSFILGPDKGSTVIITQQQQHEMYG